MQELTGASLNEFLLKRSGLTWDEVIDLRATFDDIDEAAFANGEREKSYAGYNGINNRTDI